MVAFEFVGKISRGGKIGLPKQILQQLAQHHTVRMLILADDSEEKEEEADWRRLVTEEFFRDYDPKDAAYDRMK